MNVDHELAARISYLRKVLPPHDLLGRGSDSSSIQRYYAFSNWAYRTFHSREGAMHMALNPSGEFDPSGYAVQASIIADLLPTRSEVLELGFGNGFNIPLLLQARPEARITGLDLRGAHVRAVRRRLGGDRRLRVLQGDFHHLPFSDENFDLVFGVESVCYAQSHEEVIREAYRVLRPGGRLVVFDGWRADDFPRLSQPVQDASRLAESAMALGEGTLPWSLWQAAAQRAGFTVRQEDMSEQILPTLRRLERLAWRFLRRPRLVAACNRLIPEAAQNAVAGFLMLPSAVAGGWKYRLAICEKPDEQGAAHGAARCEATLHRYRRSA